MKIKVRFENGFTKESSVFSGNLEDKRVTSVLTDFLRMFGQHPRELQGVKAILEAGRVYTVHSRDSRYNPITLQITGAI